MNEDSDKYKETLQALQVLEFDLEEKMNILKIIASILHLGNVQIYENDHVCKIENIGTVQLVADVSYYILYHNSINNSIIKFGLFYIKCPNKFFLFKMDLTTIYWL